MAKDEWIEWVKCNILEIAILILVLVLVINAFSKPAPQIEEKAAKAAIEQPQEAIQEQTPAQEVVGEENITGETQQEEKAQEIIEES